MLYAAKKSSFLSVRRNEPLHSISIPFPLMICLLSVCNLFKVRAQFPSISNLFYVRPMLTISMHVTGCDFHRVHMQGSRSRAVRRKIANLTTPIRIVSALVSHASLNHTLCLRAFCSCSSDSVSTRFWLWILKVCTYYVCT